MASPSTQAPNLSTHFPEVRNETGKSTYTSSTMEAEVYIRLVFSVILMAIIIIGNILVMAAYQRNHRIRTGTYTLLVSLAVCDFLVGSVAVPMWIYMSLSNWKPPNRFFDVFFLVIDYLTALSSALHLTAICIERWLAISKPFLHQVFTNKQYYVTLGVVWCVAVAISSLVVGHIEARIYVLILVIVGFVVPFVIICLVNMYIFQVAQKLIQQEPTAAVDATAENAKRKKIQKERKTAKTLVIITALFFFELLPAYTLALLGGFCMKACLAKMTWPALKTVMDFAKWMQYSNSAVNPFIYAFRDNEMRKTFKRIATRVVMFRRSLTVGNMGSDHQSARSNTQL